MKIGIVGLGIVGGTCKFGFEKLGHEVSVHDIKIPGSSIQNVMDSEIIFLCLPTPSKEDGSCDSSIVEDVVSQIHKIREETAYPCGQTGVKLPKPKQIIAIKSTVIPGTTDFLKKKYSASDGMLFYCFVPEFLRERCAISDFTENQDLCIIGTSNLGVAYDAYVFDVIKEAHGNLPQKFVRLTAIEAEFCKYFNNVYNATLITFANSFYEVCKKYGVNYTRVKNAMTNRKHINHFYLECNDSFRGFAGMCLPKDTKALAAISKGTGVEFFNRLLEENDKYIKTVPEGMRIEE